MLAFSIISLFRPLLGALFGADIVLILSLFADFSLLAKDLKVWRTDPGSIFDIDPLEDNIQSRSLRMLSGTTYILSFYPFTCFSHHKSVEVHCVNCVMYIFRLIQTQKGSYAALKYN